jgi:hypothetical protein
MSFIGSNSSNRSITNRQPLFQIIERLERLEPWNYWNTALLMSSFIQFILQRIADEIQRHNREHQCQTRVGGQMGRD